MKLGLILSNDWELFGDGSGDYFELQRQPLNEMLDLADEFHAPLTIMAEVGQQWGHQVLGRQESWAAEVAEAWESDVRQTVLRGSDVQLHIHPQWLDAHWNREWKLNLDEWCLSAVASEKRIAALRRGKSYLESVLCSTKAHYQCLMFRAGAYCIEPSQSVVADLSRAGLRCDTSVTQGYSNPGFCDFRAAPSNAWPWWIDEQGVTVERPAGLLVELPIASVACLESPVLRKLSGYYYTRLPSRAERRWQELRREWLDVRYPRARRPKPTPPAKASHFRRSFWHRLLRTSAVQLDYDDLPASVFVDLVERLVSDRKLQNQAAAAEQRLGREVTIPIMASGHTKTMMNCENLRGILMQLRERLGSQVTYMTGTTAVQIAHELLPSSSTEYSKTA